MDGYLLVDKPSEWTSFDVVNKVRNTLRQGGQKLKVGHTGTLDPLATGLVVVLVGKATKQQQALMQHDKTYEVEATLGLSSSTGDAEGEFTSGEERQPQRDEIEEVLGKFKGEIQQVPPAHSAIKINGQRAYKLARKGQEVKLPPRTVYISRIEVNRYDYPTLQFTAEVSSGTYIRSLVSDVGEQLGTKAYMSALRRTRVGEKHLDSAIDPRSLDIEIVKQHLRPIDLPL